MDMPLDGPPAFLAQVAACVPAMRRRAPALDAAAQFPAEDLDDLRGTGCLAAPVPTRLGGLGIGTEPAGARTTLALLRLLGRGNLPIGRIIEGHINAQRLVMLYGDAAQQRRAAADAQAGHLFALWIAEADPLRLITAASPVLRGRKSFGSAVGAATRAVVTATDDGGRTSMVLVAADHPCVVPEKLVHPPQGMRAAGNGGIAFRDAPAPPDAIIGAPGDYLREPEFSAGAWRASAVALGGLEAVIEAARDQIRARGRDDRPASARPHGPCPDRAGDGGALDAQGRLGRGRRGGGGRRPARIRQPRPHRRRNPRAWMRCGWCSARSVSPRSCRPIRSSGWPGTSAPSCASRRPIRR